MPSTTEINLEEIYAFTLDLAKQAGQMILEGSNKRTGSAHTQTGDAVESKKNRVDRTSASLLSIRSMGGETGGRGRVVEGEGKRG